MVTAASESGLMAHYKSDEKAVMIDNGATQDKEPNTDQSQGTDWKKRYDDLKRYYDDQLNNWKSEKDNLAQKIQDNKITYTPPKSIEELENFKKENPDVYGIAETLAHMKASEQVKNVQKEIEDLNSLRSKLSRDAAFKELRAYHPDFEELRKDATFKNWSSKQPKQIQDWLFKETDAKLTARAIDLFKAEHRNVTKEKTNTNASAAMAVNTKSEVDTNSKGPKIWSRAEIERMPLNEFEAQRDDINKAMKEGRIR